MLIDLAPISRLRRAGPGRATGEARAGVLFAYLRNRGVARARQLLECTRRPAHAAPQSRPRMMPPLTSRVLTDIPEERLYAGRRSSGPHPRPAAKALPNRGSGSSSLSGRATPGWTSSSPRRARGGVRFLRLDGLRRSRSSWRPRGSNCSLRAQSSASAPGREVAPPKAAPERACPSATGPCVPRRNGVSRPSDGRGTGALREPRGVVGSPASRAPRRSRASPASMSSMVWSRF